MAGRGPAPKPRGHRRNTSAPLRGEWVDLEPLEKPVLPPAEPDWGDETRRAWEIWRGSPVTAQYGPEDLYAIRQLALLMETEKPVAAELRLRMDGLGLTPKGKRDLRWRTPGEVATIQRQGKQAEVRQLRAVADAVEG